MLNGAKWRKAAVTKLLKLWCAELKAAEPIKLEEEPISKKRRQ